MKKLLVIGGSRGVGKALCNAATARGIDVRAMSRSGRERAGASPAFETVQGDALDPIDIGRALEGVDTVALTLGVPVSLDLLTKPVTLFSEATMVLLPEMRKAGVNRLVAVTGFGAGDSNPRISILQRLPFEFLLGRAYQDKSVQERLIERSDLDWLIVRPGVLTDGPATGDYRVLLQPHEWRNGIVSRRDVADYIATRIMDETLGREKANIIRYPL